MEATTLTRRSFVKASALTAAAAVIGLNATHSLVETDEAFAASTDARTAVHTCCHGCIQNCPCICYVEDGVIVKIEGDPSAPVSKGAMCLKGMAQLHTVYSPRHVLYPMKRVGDRGAENASWERVSWDEAIDTVSDQLITIVSKYGPYSVWMGTGGGGQYVSPQGQVIPKAFGGGIQISGGALQCYGPRRLAAALMLGSEVSVNLSMADAAVVEPFNDYSPTMEVCVIWGASPSISQVAQSGHGMADARVDRGVKTVVIDPFMTPDAAKADVWLPVRPGSDSALVLCWIRYVIENNLYDETFCKYWTNLPFLVDPDTGLPLRAEEVWSDYKNPAEDPNGVYDTPAYVCFDARTNSVQPFPYSAPEDSPVDPVVFTSATVNGKECKTAGQIYREEADPWTLDKTAEVCWLDANKIEEGVRLYAEAEHAGIVEGVFADMQEVSGNVPIGIMALEMMMGHVYKPGSTLTDHTPAPDDRPTIEFSHNLRWGMGWAYGYTEEENKRRVSATRQEFIDEGKDPDAMTQQAFKLLSDRYASDKYRGAFFIDMTHMGSIREACVTGEPYRVRILLEVSGNKMCTIANVNKWYDAYMTQDYIAQQYTNMTSFTAEFADILLPIQEWAEYNSGENLINQDNYNYLRRQVIHLGETVAPERPFMAICEKVAEKAGEDFFFDYPYLKTGNPRVLYDDIDAKKEKWAKSYGAESWQDLLDNQDKYIPQITPPDEYWIYNQHEKIVSDGLPAGFATESRKCQPYVSAFIQLGKTGFPFLWPYALPDVGLQYSPICKYHEFDENGLQNDTDYPLVFTSGRIPHFHHGTLRHAAFNREIAPAPWCFIHPDTAASYGIEAGDWVKISSRRGDAYGVAYLTRGINPRVIREERFWYPECFDDTATHKTGGWQYGISTLTRDDVADSVIGSATYRGFNVQIEKSEKPDGIWTEPEQFEPFLPTLQNEPQTDEVIFK